jgi:dinuclear metal center YbgI/SA1388 family protein
VTTPTLAQVVDAVERLWHPRWAQSWDAVGLVCGDPEQPVSRVHLAVDPLPPVVDEALDRGADLLLTHHPLFLRGTSSVAATTSKGRSVHRLVRGGCALLAAHTNADAADPGVSDALASAVGLVDLVPLEPVADAAAPATDKIVVFVPGDAADAVVDAMAAAGAGVIGAYERCWWGVEGSGSFRPLPGATPTIGAVGRVERVAEVRVEMVVPRRRRAAAVAALRAAHPYEEPAFDVYETAAVPGPLGIGRVGRLPEPTTLDAFADAVAAALPLGAGGLRVAGEASRRIERVAVCGGSGDSMFGPVRAAGVDAYLTADLRHHPVTDVVAEAAVGQRVPALLDAGHFATEWPWLPVAARQLTDALAAAGLEVPTEVSTLVTDPWTLHRPPRGR